MNLPSTDPQLTVENLLVRNRITSLAIYVTILLLVCLVCLSLPFVFVDISAQSRGIIRSAHENVAVNSLASGKITAVRVKNNQQVQAGDTLFTVEISQLKTQASLLAKQKTDLQSMLHDINQVLNGKNDGFQVNVFQQEYNQYKAHQQALMTQSRYAVSEFNRSKVLFEQAVIPALEFEKYQFEVKQAHEKLISFERQQAAHWAKQKKDLIDEDRLLIEQHQQNALDQTHAYAIAPISGTIIHATGLHENSFYTGGTTIADISPNDSLVAECLISPKDIGMIHPKQAVKFQLDAFNYNQWGFVSGKVIDIDKNASQENNQVYFRVRCQLNRAQIQLKNGYPVALRKGLTLTGRFFITRRSLFQLIFDKVDHWLNPLNYSPQA